MDADKNEKSRDITELSIQEIINGASGIIKAKLGLNKIDKDEVMRRKSICLAPCEKLNTNNSDKFSDYKCGKCGCWLKYKILLSNERCPLDKW